MIDTQTHFIAACPHCSAGLKVRRAYLGQQVRCKQCNAVFTAEEGPVGGEAVPGETRAWPGSNPSAPPVERIVVACPNCQAPLSVRRAYIGQQVRCKQCDEAFRVTDPGGNGPVGSSDDHAAAANGRGVDLKELDRLRGEVERLSAENQRLQSEADRIRSEHGQVERLSAENQRLQSEVDRVRSEHGELRSAHAGLEAAHDELQAAHARLQAENADVMTAHAGLLSTHDQRASEAGELKTAHDQIAAENERLARITGGSRPSGMGSWPSGTSSAPEPSGSRPSKMGSWPSGTSSAPEPSGAGRAGRTRGRAGPGP